jgi:hypothetical protein
VSTDAACSCGHVTCPCRCASASRLYALCCRAHASFARQLCAASFEAIDGDGDGFVSMSDLRVFMANLMGLSLDLVDKFYEGFHFIIDEIGFGDDKFSCEQLAYHMVTSDMVDEAVLEP